MTNRVLLLLLCWAAVAAGLGLSKATERASHELEANTDDQGEPSLEPVTPKKKMHKVEAGFKKLVKEMAQFSGVSAGCVKRFLLDLPPEISQPDESDTENSPLEEDELELDIIPHCSPEDMKKIQSADKKFGGKSEKKKKDLEEEAVDYIHKGEFDPITDLFLSASSRQLLPLVNVLVTAALLQDAQVHVASPYDWNGHHANSFLARLRRTINGFSDNVGQRQYTLNHNGRVVAGDLPNADKLTATGRVATHVNRFVARNTRTIWMRDFGPLFTCDANNQERHITAFEYHRRHDHQFPQTLAGVFPSDGNPDTPFHRLAINIAHGAGAGAHDIGAEGGNIQANGETCIISQYFINTNLHGRTPRVIKPLIEDELESRLGCTRLTVVPNMFYEGTKHVDMYISWTGARRIIIGKTRNRQDPKNKRLMNTNKSLIKRAIDGRFCLRNCLTVDRVIMPSRCPLNELPQYYGTLGLDRNGRWNPRPGAPHGNWGSYQMALMAMEGLSIPQMRAQVMHQANPNGQRARRRLNTLMDKMVPAYGVRWACKELDHNDRDFNLFIYRSYANALIVGDIVVVPRYLQLERHWNGHVNGQQDDDVHLHKADFEDALAVWLTQPNINRVFTGDSDTQISIGGSAHCTTQTAREC